MHVTIGFHHFRLHYDATGDDWGRDKTRWRGDERPSGWQGGGTAPIFRSQSFRISLRGRRGCRRFAFRADEEPEHFRRKGLSGGSRGSYGSTGWSAFTDDRTGHGGRKSGLQRVSAGGYGWAGRGFITHAIRGKP